MQIRISQGWSPNDESQKERIKHNYQRDIRKGGRKKKGEGKLRREGERERKEKWINININTNLKEKLKGGKMVLFLS
jgi:hypothetical protein